MAGLCALGKLDRQPAFRGIEELSSKSHFKMIIFDQNIDFLCQLQTRLWWLVNIYFKKLKSIEMMRIEIFEKVKNLGTIIWMNYQKIVESKYMYMCNLYMYIYYIYVFIYVYYYICIYIYVYYIYVYYICVYINYIFYILYKLYTYATFIRISHIWNSNLFLQL